MWKISFIYKNKIIHNLLKERPIEKWKADSAILVYNINLPQLVGQRALKGEAMYEYYEGQSFIKSLHNFFMKE